MDERKDNHDHIIEEKVKKVLGTHPEYKLSEAKTREYISWLFNVAEERKRLVDFVSRSRVSIFSAAAVSLVAVIAAFNYFLAPLHPVVTNVHGTVKIYRASRNEWVFTQKPGAKLGKNDILKTFEDGRADLVMPGVYHMRLKNNSEIKLAKSVSRAVPGGILYALSQGKVFAHYNKAEGINRRMVMQTPQATATALGTDFMVASMPALNQTTVGVLDGAVKVNSLQVSGLATRADKGVLVRAGERTVVRQGAAPAAPTRLMENELLEMEELYSIGIRPQVALLISTGPTRTRELLSVTPLYISSEKSGVLTEKFEPIAREINKAIKDGSREEHLENIKRLEALIREYPNQKYDVQFLLFIGAYYEYIGEYRKAISTFERVIRGYPGSSLTSIAQCAIGIIYEERLKDPFMAEGAYRKVLSDYPQSPESEEAKAGLNRLSRQPK